MKNSVVRQKMIRGVLFASVISLMGCAVAGGSDLKGPNPNVGMKTGMKTGMKAGMDANPHYHHKKTHNPLEREVAAGKILPYYVVFLPNGSSEIRTIGENTFEPSVAPSEFPIGKGIRKVETLTFVTYEGSCEVLAYTSTGYKKIIINNDRLCAIIQP